jgi:tetratricopeptide (TPR) repeat protein
MSRRELLDSWKAIADYLGRRERTCQLWEKDLGLPVHRLNDSPKARVFAYRDEIDRWLLERRSRYETPGRFAGRKLLKRSIFAAAALVLMSAAFLLWRRVVRTEPAASSGRPTIAVLDFENLSLDTTLDPWRYGIPELLITELSRSRFLSVLARDQAVALLSKGRPANEWVLADADLNRIAAENGLTHFVTGSFLCAEDKIVVTMSLRDALTGQVIQRHDVECGSQDEILAKAADLALQVKQNLNLSAAQLTADAEIYRKLEPATGSAEAFKYFLEGRRLQGLMEYPASISHMEKAVEVDPQFATAYRSMASAYRNLGLMAQAVNYGRRSLELSGRLPELERMLIEANYGIWTEDNARTVNVLERILKLYPDNLMARTNLSILVLSDLDRVIELRDFVYRHHRTPLTANNLAHAHMMKGLYPKAEAVCLEYLQDVGDSVGVRDRLIAAYVCGGKFDAALAEAEKNALSHPGDEYIQTGWGDVRLFKGDLDGAAEIYRRNPLLQSYVGRSNLIVLDLVRGRFEDAVTVARRNLAEAGQDKRTLLVAYVDLSAAIEKSGRYEEAAGVWEAYLRLLAEWRASADEDTPPDLPSGRRRELFIKGRLLALRGLEEEAAAAARELDALAEMSVDRSDRRYAEYLRGLIAFRDRDPRKAAGLFGRARARLRYEAKWEDSFDHALFYDGLARALFESGDLRGAEREYEGITCLTYGRLSHGDIYAKAFYMLGRIAEKRRDRVRARENYGRFLELWADADRGLPEVEDARTRMAALDR